MPTSIQSARLDRLSALLKAVAPRVTVGQADSAHAHSLCVYLVTAPDRVVIIAARSAHTLHSLAAMGAAPAVCLQVHMDGPAASLLMREFAQPLVVPLAGADTALTQAVQLVCAELAAPRCGQPAMLASAGDILFIGLLRHLVAHPQAASGLFAGLADPRIAAALVAMQERPQAPWDLESLAAQAGMSRTAFTTRFKDAMNTPPGKYLAQLRLHIAQRAVDSGKGLKGAARESGYRDVSALSRALGRARLAPAATPAHAHG